MRNTCKLTLIFINLSLLSVLGISQKAIKVFKTFDSGSEPDLQMSIINQVTKDDFGYRWICGRGGLVKYDGLKFRRYFPNSSDTTSIPDITASCFLETSEKKYLVGTYNGFSIFNRKKGNFENFYSVPQDTTSINNHAVWDIKEDLQGNIFVATESGLNQFHFNTKTFTRFKKDVDAHSFGKTKLLIDPTGELWLSSDIGLFKVDREELRLKKIDLSQFPELNSGIKSMVLVGDDELYLGSKKGLFNYNISNGQLEKILLGKEINDEAIYSLAQDQDSVLFIGSRFNGVIKWNLKSKQLEDHYKFDPLVLNGLSNNGILSLFLDDNLLWIGTVRGINITEKDQGGVCVYPIEPGHKNPGNKVNHVFADHNSNIWFQTASNKGLFRKESLSSEPILISPPNIKEKPFMCKGITADKSGVIWTLDHNSEFLMKYDSDVLSNVESYAYFKNAKLLGLQFDDFDRNVLLLSSTHGFCKYNVVTRDTTWIYPTAYSETAKSNDVRCITQDGPNKYWFLNNYKLCSYDAVLDSIKVIETNPEDSLALKSTITCDIEIDEENVYVVGSAGLDIYCKSEDRCYNYGPSNSDILTALTATVKGNDGRIWFLGSGNIGYYDPITKYVEYNKHYLENAGNIWGAISISPDGTILAGTVNGLLAFHPDRLEKDTTNPNIVLSKFSLYGLENEFENEVEFINNIELSYEESRMFTIDFSPLHYWDVDYNRYFYNVNGITDGWEFSGFNRDLICRDLAPGVYNYQVKSSNSSGVMSKNKLALTIKINKPFYQTWWFYSLIALAVLTIIYLLILNWKKRIQLKEEKELAEKNAHYKTKFLSNMSHEIRTPMNGIMGLNKLMMDSNLDKKQKKYTDAINVSCENLLWIINDILDQAKIESGKFSLKEEPFDLRSIVEQVGTLLSHKIEEKDLQLNIDIDKTVPEILLGDGTRLFQVITNLVGNSIKFTQEGSISIIVNSDYDLEADSHDIQFEVHDTGIGIPQEKLSTIFQSFEQLDDQNTGQSYAPQGTGLGLTIAKEIVELQNGTIRVDSIAGQGTTFYFTIPFKKGVRKISYNQEKLIKDLPKGLRVLLVEDNQINQFLASELLKKNLIDVMIDVADNGEIALEKIESRNYDLVLMDVQMPIMGGKEATRAIRSHDGDYFKTVPILGLTASAINEELEDCLNSGMNDYTTKPIDTNELFLKIKHLINDKY